MALTTIKDSWDRIVEAFSKSGVAAKEASESFAALSQSFGAFPAISNGENFTITSSTISTDGTGDTSDNLPYESGTYIQGDEYVWVDDQTITPEIGPEFSVSAVRVPYYTSTTIDLGREGINETGLLNEIIHSGGSPMEIEQLGQLSRSTGIGVRELLSLFTSIGEQLRVRRDMAESDYLEAITPFMRNGLIDTTKQTYAILCVKGEYAKGILFDEKDKGDTIKITVKSTNTAIPTIRAIRIPGIKPKKLVAVFTKKHYVSVDCCDLSFPIYDTEDDIYLSKDGNFYKEV